MTTHYTKYFRFPVPDFLTEPWVQELSTTFDVIDAQLFNNLAAAQLMNWKNSTSYVVGDVTIDADYGTVWSCLTAHNSAPAPTTFLEDRIAHPGYWGMGIIAVANAATVAYANGTSGLASTNAQGAIDEIDSNLDAVEAIIPTLATKVYVDAADALKAPLASPVFTGDPQVPTQVTSDNDTSIASTAFVRNAIATYTPPSIPDAPNDGQQYARQSQAWTVVITGGGGGGASTPSDALPTMAGVAAPGTSILYSRGDHVHPSDTSRVVKAGDTMTGNLTIATATAPALNLQKTAASDIAAIYGYRGTALRWVIPLGNGATESGSNSGSNFEIARYDDSGAYIDSPVSIVRNSGNTFLRGAVTFSVSPVVTTTGATPATLTLNKGAQNTGVNIIGQSVGVNRWSVSIANGNPETGSNAGSDFSINRYNDAGAVIDSPIAIARTNGAVTFTGAPIVGADPTVALGVATKQYSDKKVLKTGDVMSGNLNISTAWPSLILNRPAAGTAAQLASYVNNNPRWNLLLGDSGAESGGNAGSNIVLYRYDDSGTYLDTPISVLRSSGVVYFAQSPVAPTPAPGANDTRLATTAFVATATSSGSTGRMLSIQSFTASNPSVTIPAGATTAYVRLWAAGGGRSTYGGSGGGYLEKFLTGLTPGNTLNLVVGAGGSSTGGNSTLSSGTQAIGTLTCNGGNAGTSSGIAGGTATGGDFNLQGAVGGSTTSVGISGYSGGAFSYGGGASNNGQSGGCVIIWMS